jgi:hypothetical protein
MTPRLILYCLFTLGFAATSLGQSKPLPKFTAAALVNSELARQTESKPYTLVIHGGVNCGYCRLLIANLTSLEDCAQIQVVLLIEDKADSIRSRMAPALQLYPTYSNQVLQHQFAQGNAISPQTFLFRGEEEILYVKGFKKNIFARIRKATTCANDPEKN